MTNISPTLIRGLITQNGTLSVPQAIADAIGSCTTSEARSIREEGEQLKAKYNSFEDKEKPAVLDYSSDVTIDAYSVYYLPRNSLVPKVAIMCCSYSAAFQSLPSRLRILDLGSGTGGVGLGLLDLFHNKALLATCLDIVALDVSQEALRRQSQLVNHMGLHGSSLQCHRADLSDPKDYISKLPVGAPYDMVFAANILIELGEPTIDALLQHVVPLLSESGIVVVVESQSNYTKKQKARIAKDVKNLGLHIYYPCPPNLTCSRYSCWKWRNDEFECPSIMVHGEALETTKIQKAHWMILSKRSCSIYDILHSKNPQLVWGVAASGKVQIEEDKVKYDYEFCTENGWFPGTIEQEKNKLLWPTEDEPFKRGTIVGITWDDKEIKEGWDIVSGFVSY
ncbi:methyltransferase domain-containing protein [Candidatus Bathyarchaeota archaeon]|nr:methyltransferase domain-containing protein [Candidatus Bathyarchaeota archaeon]